MPAGEAAFVRSGSVRPGIPVAAHDPAHEVADGDVIRLAGLELHVVGVPGHSIDHVAFFVDGSLFAGDLLFAGSVGRVDLPGGSWDAARRLDRSAARAVRTRTRRLSGARRADDARPGARHQPVPGRAPDGALMAERFQAPRGTHDILPSDQPVWFDTLVATIERLARLYGYRRIQTPTFEDTDLFQRTSGTGSDVVQKEMYTFTDRSDRSLTLRPEGTAPICRAYVEHGMHREPQPVKLYTLAPMFRYAAPQKGRYREHWQLSLEAIGSSDPAIDAEVIQFYRRLLGELGISAFRLELNSIGDAACRPAYLARAQRLARRARRRAGCRGEGEARDEPAARVRREDAVGA